MTNIETTVDDSVGRGRLRKMVEHRHLRAVIFDLDGTLIQSRVPFAPYRDRLGIDGDVIAGIEALPGDEQAEKWSIIAEYEMELQNNSKVALGATELLEYLNDGGMGTGVITRSTGSHARMLIQKHDLDIGLSIGREDTRPKPHPEGIHYLLQQLGTHPDHAIMVGDFLWDILAGRNAGLLTVLVLQEHSIPFADEADVVVGSLIELLDLLRTEG